MQSRRPPILLIIILVVAAIVVYQHRHGVVSRFRALTNVRPVGKSVLEAGQPMPVVQLTNLAGERLSIKPKPGRILYLNVFATWCPSCQKETPALQGLALETKAMPVDVVGVDQEEDISPVSEFAQRYGLTYPIFIDDQGYTARLMGVRFIPTSFIVDSKGVVRARITGAITLQQMEQAVGVVLHGGTVASN